VDPLTLGLGLGIVSAGASFYGSAQQAKAQEEYTKQSYAAQLKAITANQVQIREQESVEKYKIQNQAHLIASRIRASAGESGIGFGGSYQALLRQTDYDEMMNIEIIRRNAAAKLQGLVVEPVRTQPFSPLLDAFSGGVSGFSTGLQIGNLVRK
jgi:hypothetical protein